MDEKNGPLETLTAISILLSCADPCTRKSFTAGLAYRNQIKLNNRVFIIEYAGM